LYVDGIDEIVERLQAAGFRARSDGPVDITAGPNKGARSIYLQDPDGYPVELFQRRPGG
jgi:catechol 2,3-dioxygenase-like lactoylglutathione lyase family enzyme